MRRSERGLLEGRIRNFEQKAAKVAEGETEREGLGKLGNQEGLDALRKF
jgi:hypothetical protein